MFAQHRPARSAWKGHLSDALLQQERDPKFITGTSSVRRPFSDDRDAEESEEWQTQGGRRQRRGSKALQSWDVLATAEGESGHVPRPGSIELCPVLSTPATKSTQHFGSLIFIDDRRGALNRLDRSLTLEGGPRGRPWCRGGDSRSPSRLPRSSHLRLLAILDKPSYELNFGPALSSVHEIMCLLVILWPIFSRSLNELI